MTTLRPRFLRGRPLTLAFLALLAVAVGACSSAAGPSAVPSTSPPPAATVPSAGPDTPVGTDLPPATGDPGAVDPIAGRLVVPVPGQLDVRPIAAQTLSAAVDGRRVVLTIAWTSGVEPCYVLDSIVVTSGPGSFAITLREGHGPGDVACIEMAEFKHAVVDLGELEPGTYQITDAAGGAAPISVAVA